VNDDRLSVAVVTPWFGAGLTGGAERTAVQVATGLARRGHRVQAITTCAAGFAADWGTDAHRPGESLEDGVRVRRFAVDPRNRDAFDRANEVLLGRALAYYRGGGAVEPEIAHDFIASGINSSGAIAALRAALDQLDAVLVLPYPYGLSMQAIDAAGALALLQPCLHDEAYAYLPAVEETFRTSGAILFNTAGERRIACHMFGPSIVVKSLVVGTWVDEPPLGPVPERVGRFRPRERRYVLYLGRRDATKNIDLLVESFAAFRRRHRMSRLELVLAGPGSRSFADARHDVHDVGYVDEAQKTALLAGALALAQPSVNESFSRVLMEGWRYAKPALVNGRCDATADAVRETGAGWTPMTKAQWTSTFETIDALPPEQLENYGARGRRYVEEQTSREKILDRYETVIRAVRGRTRRSRFDAVPAPALAQRLRDGRKTILFAGPLVETSGIEQLLTGFAFLLSFGLDARLVLLGEFDREETLADRFFDQVANSGLAERVVVLEPSRLDAVAACYRAADLFWSMAEDGPARELIDALGYGVPLFAFANPFARHIAGDAGLLFNDKTQPRTLAGVAALLLTDRALRDTLVDGQRRRFEALYANGELERVG
jgi:glycosyltransferase involved in cell wall biosynthesis